MIHRTRQMEKNVFKHSVTILARRVKFVAKKHLRKSKSFVCSNVASIREKIVASIREKITVQVVHTSDCIKFEASARIGQARYGVRFGIANANSQSLPAHIKEFVNTKVNVTTNSSFIVTVRTGRQSRTFIADVVKITHRLGIRRYHLQNPNHDYSTTFTAAELSAAMNRSDLTLL